LEKAAQRGLIGELCQAQQREECAVVLEDVGLAEAAQTGDNGQEQRQQQIGGQIVPTAMGQRENTVEAAAQLESLTKTLHHQTAEVSQVRLVERKAQYLEPFWHGRNGSRACLRPLTQTYLKGRKASDDPKAPFRAISQALLAGTPCQFTLFEVE
jgi:hypothetical protein